MRATRLGSSGNREWEDAMTEGIDRGRDGRLLYARRNLGDGLLHGCGAPVLLQPVRRLDAVRELLLLGARADVAEPLLLRRRNVRRDHDERRLGLRRLRLSDHP